ncbi:MAG: protein arginine kinase [Clostridia bacterium]|nr:protein arginine kinase [Clostridia bacterium]
MWYTKFGPSGDVVLSSRIRLARNIADIPFVSRMNKEHESQVINRCKAAMPEMTYIDFSSMTKTEILALSESHLVSPEMVENKRQCGILTNSDCSECIMLNEEDHIRIQTMAPGLNLELCLTNANRLDDRLESTVDYGYHKDFGYLTACPTNVGTGMRASVMVHLPALTKLGKMESIIRSLSKLGITVRGFYGEGSKAFGDIYQISNQITLGVSEEDTIDKLTQVIGDIIEKERSLGQKLYSHDKFTFEDKIMRSYGILTNARILTSGETVNLISEVRWGINLGIIKDIDLETMSEVFYDVLPATITKNHNLTTALERDLKRAELIGEKLNS